MAQLGLAAGLDGFNPQAQGPALRPRGRDFSTANVKDLSFETCVSHFDVIDTAGFRQFSLLVAIARADLSPSNMRPAILNGWSRLSLYGTYALGRMRWKDQPNEVEKAWCCSTSRGSAGNKSTTPFSQVWAACTSSPR